ncbi:MAG: sulfotransferase domain-containing protein [Pseudomonadales bacterium]
MKLDFLVIGAQKSATTAVFKYLQPHERLAMPAAKEAPLFVRESSAEEAEEFMEEHFMNTAGKLRGKATPQYMCDQLIPARIHRHNPDIKLIAVLRDPIDRAWSHYRMNKRRDAEGRDFESAMLASLEPEVLARGRLGSAPSHAHDYESEADFYLPWGEYGRILQRYLDFFSRDQLLVIYTSELSQAPAATLDKILQFLGLEAGFRPACLGEVVHKGGSERLISKRTVTAIRDFWPVQKIWQRLPDNQKGTLRYWFEQFNVKTADEPMPLSESTRALLQVHFAKDAKLLAALTGRQPYWM